MSSTAGQFKPGERNLPAEVAALPEEMKRLLGIVAILASESRSTREVVQHCLETVCDFTGWPLGHAFLREGVTDSYRSTGSWCVTPPEAYPAFRTSSDNLVVRRGAGVVGRAAERATPLVLDRLTAVDEFVRQTDELAGHAAVFVPLITGGEPAGVLEFFFPADARPAEDLERVLGMIGAQVGRVVERDRSAQALRLSEAMFAGIIGISSDAIVSVDADQRIITFNRGAEQIFGYSAEEAVGEHLDLLIPRQYHAVHREHVEQFGAGPEVARRMGERGQIAGRRKSGEVFQADASISKLEVAGRRIYTAVLRDVTDRVRAEQELARSNAELEQFAYVASHDLQEPLRMVASFTQLLERRYGDQLGDDGREFISFAVDGVLRMQALINDLLAFSRVGTRARPFEETDTGVLVDRVIRDLAPAIEEHGASVEHGDLPLVVADGGQLSQVFQNLIGNALKFRRAEAEPLVRITARREVARWIFSVADNGIGIAPEYRERIFVLFQRLHSRAEYPGTGIGLAICKKVVERHGGEIWFESERGIGTNFHFSIPDHPGPAMPR